MVSLLLGYVAMPLDDWFLTFDDYVISKRRKPITQWSSMTSLNSGTLSYSAVKTSKLALWTVIV